MVMLQSSKFTSILLLVLSCAVGYTRGECPAECLCVPGTDPQTGAEEWVVTCVEVSEIPASWPQDIQPLRELYFTGLKQDVIPSDSFSSLTSIRRLSIRFSTIGRIESGAFSGMVGYGPEAVLMLGFNDIGTIESQAFQNVKQMASIQLISGTIETIESQAFTDIETGSIIMTGVTLGELGLNAFGPSVEFTTDFDLPSSLKAIPDDVIQQLPELNSTGFTGCEQLQIKDSTTSFISLVSNTIQVISSGAFSGITLPTLLNLHGNTIGLVETGIFGPAGGATLVSFIKNDVEGLSNNAFKGLSGSDKFVLNSNNVSCAGDESLMGIEASQVIQEDNEVRPVSESDNSTNCQAVLLEPSTAAPSTTLLVETSTPEDSRTTTSKTGAADRSAPSLLALATALLVARVTLVYCGLN